MDENKRICRTATLFYKSLKEKGLYKKVMWFVPMPHSLEEEEEIEKQMIEQHKDLEKEWERVGFNCSPTWTDLDERDYQERKEEESNGKE